MAGPIETKAYLGTIATFAGSYGSALLLETIPWLQEHLTPDQQKSLPAFIATVITALVTYYAPHTHRPDLQPPQPPVVVFDNQPDPDTPQPAPVTTEMAAIPGAPPPKHAFRSGSSG